MPANGGRDARSTLGRPGPMARFRSHTDGMIRKDVGDNEGAERLLVDTGHRRII